VQDGGQQPVQVAKDLSPIPRATGGSTAMAEAALTAHAGANLAYEPANTPIPRHGAAVRPSRTEKNSPASSNARGNLAIAVCASVTVWNTSAISRVTSVPKFDRAARFDQLNRELKEIVESDPAIRVLGFLRSVRWTKETACRRQLP
jgi:hypothetical protein